MSTTEETTLDTIFSDIPLNFIEAIKPDTKMHLHTTIDLSVRTPSGDINKISFAFLDTAGQKIKISLIPRMPKRYQRTPERDDFVRMLEKARQDFSDSSSESAKGSDSEDPMKILKIRFAKGEITREEYDDMAEILG